MIKQMPVNGMVMSSGLAGSVGFPTVLVAGQKTTTEQLYHSIFATAGSLKPPRMAFIASRIRKLGKHLIILRVSVFEFRLTEH